MTRLLVCPRGHRWEITGADAPAAPGAFACPACGAECAVTAADATNDGTLPGPEPTFIVPGAGRPAAPPPALPGYDLLGILGAGGMGVVYRARQWALNRPVALKMILAGRHATPQQLIRFQIEAEALASLRHPNVVQVYEVGEHDQCPFLAMELIEGGSLATNLAGRPMPPAPAAALVATIARAIHAAHLRGIVHRDLKPANILLQKAEGRKQKDESEPSVSSFILHPSSFLPKITDFGLAKRLGEDATGQTQTGLVLGTPSYMAPEQAGGDPHAVGPAADGYALGALLYELLTGRPPFHGASTLETLEQVRTRDPAPPRTVRPGVPRDLETICLKCLHKDPARRYESAAALADDLDRFLDHRPIKARPVGFAERAWKWAVRHQAAATVLAVVLCAAILVTAVMIRSTVQEARSAAEMRHQLTEARLTAEELFTELAGDGGGDETLKDSLQQKIAQKILHIYESLALKGGDDPALQRDAARARVLLGQVRHRLHQHAEARTLYDEAIAALERLHAEDPAEPTYREELASAYNWLGELRREAGRTPADAEAAYRRALGLQHDLVRDFPDRPRGSKDLARSHYNLGIVTAETGRPAAAADHLDRAITLLQGLSAGDGARADYRHELARSLINRGVLHKDGGRAGAAAADFRAALDHLARLREARDDKVVYRVDAAVTHQNLGNLYWTDGRPDEAIAALDQARRDLHELARAFPTRPAYRAKLANVLNSLASVHATKNGRDLDAARASWRQAADTLDPLVRLYPDVPGYRHHLGLTLGNLGWLASEQQAWAGARGHLEGAADHLRQILAANPKNANYRRDLRNQYQNLGEVLLQLKDHAAASRAADALADLCSDRGQDVYIAACFTARCAALADGDTARRYGDRVVALLQRAARCEGPPVSRVADEGDIFRRLNGRPDVRVALAALSP